MDFEDFDQLPARSSRITDS